MATTAVAQMQELVTKGKPVPAKLEQNAYFECFCVTEASEHFDHNYMASNLLRIRELEARMKKKTRQ